MTWSQILTFVLATTLLVTSPGPNGVLIARTVPTSGRAAGFATILGFFAAFYVHGTLSILGISIILTKSAIAFAIVKYLGAAYLCWIGVKALVAAWRGVATVPAVTPARRRRTLLKAFGEGFLTNGLNPKVSMFYLAVFPQFIPLNAHPVAWAFLLVYLHSMINVIWFSSIVLLFSKLTRVTRGGRFQRWLKAVTGGVFISFGLKLATLRPSV
ncbi:threonine/homoserine/homoserine lactone efflux protein [Hoeflea marina]|uniref:Threonine/homoserine/homoserine lactone efflux protein n=1 Tax=Hoeflea marina TaxID=274592 RepID=A0A317PR01_9HYPH|nr:LysE family translocator [Hoeflea marina]PWW03367.1 threonine/homoserine/homoserine lactone efflux protein [Hoeflea marina]